MTEMRWKRVSGRRFAAQFSLCILAVYISSLMAQRPFPTAMIWGGAPYIGLIFSFATQFGPPGITASRIYCSITTVMLLYLDKAATAVGKTAEPSFDNAGLQHSAVHFALAFFLLSELEYHRQYFATKGIKFEDFYNSPWLSLMPDADHTFNVSRTPSGYWYTHEQPDRIASIRYFWLRMCILDLIPFALVGGCFNYVITRVVNQSRTRDREAMFAIANFNVFFNTTNPWIVQLNLWVLSRVVRQANFITVWGSLRASASALDWWNSNGTSWSYSQHPSTQDPETDHCLQLQSQTAEKS